MEILQKIINIALSIAIMLDAINGICFNRRIFALEKKAIKNSARVRLQDTELEIVYPQKERLLEDGDEKGGSGDDDGDDASNKRP